MFHFVNSFQKFGVKRVQHEFSMIETPNLGKDSSAPPRIVPQKEGNRFVSGDWSPSFLNQCKRNKVFFKGPRYVNWNCILSNETFKKGVHFVELFVDQVSVSTSFSRPLFFSPNFDCSFLTFRFIFIGVATQKTFLFDSS